MIIGSGYLCSVFTSSTVLSGPGDFKVYETYTPGVKNPGRRRSTPGFLGRIVSSCLESGRTQSSLGSMMFRMFEPEPSIMWGLLVTDTV